jgi:glycerate-2-kinase
VPNAALRTPRDIASAARVLGLDSLAVQRQVTVVPASDPPAASGNYLVFASRAGHIVPVPITTGLTDQDYIEVMSGLTERDSVVVLTSGGGK